MDLLPGEVVDRYEIETVLGEGGMARVFRARHTGLGTLHAVKLLTTATPHIRARLLQEGRVQASLKHPHIVAVHDIIDVDGAPGLVMEYVDGPTLGALLAHGHMFSEAQLDALALSLFDAVEHAHGVQVVHRDLKPANVLLARSHRDIVPKITDFGLAKLLSTDRRDSATRSGVAMGTPAYMAPEQVRDAKYVGPAADLWSLGAILFELITQQRAFAGDDVFEIYRRVVEGERPPVLDLAEAPERMVRAIDAALLVDLEERVAAVDELRRLWVDGMPSHEGPVWDEGELERIGALGHGGKPWSVSDSVGVELDSAMRPRRTSASKSEETLVLGDETIPEPALAPPASLAETPVSLPASVAPTKASGSAPQLAFASGLLLVGAAATWLLWPSPTPNPTPEAAPVAPVAAPAPPSPPAPAVAPPEPEPTPVPETPKPAAVPRTARTPPKPAPRKPPTPVAVAEPTPAPQPEPAPAPEPSAEPEPTTAVHVVGFDDVHLFNTATAETRQPGEVPPGTWQVYAMFGGQPTPTEPFDVAEGQQITVRCSATLGKCSKQ